MSKRKYGSLVFGIMILLALGLAACSTESSVVVEPTGVENPGRDIKVYESPT